MLFPFQPNLTSEKKDKPPLGVFLRNRCTVLKLLKNDQTYTISNSKKYSGTLWKTPRRWGFILLIIFSQATKKKSHTPLGFSQVCWLIVILYRYLKDNNLLKQRMTFKCRYWILRLQFLKLGDFIFKFYLWQPAMN